MCWSWQAPWTPQGHEHAFESPVQDVDNNHLVATKRQVRSRRIHCRYTGASQCRWKDALVQRVSAKWHVRYTCTSVWTCPPLQLLYFHVVSGILINNRVLTLPMCNTIVACMSFSNVHSGRICNIRGGESLGLLQTAPPACHVLWLPTIDMKYFGLWRLFIS